MKFLGDMGIAGSTVSWLKAQGYDAKHLRDEGLQRLPDDKIFAKAEDGAIISVDEYRYRIRRLPILP